MNAIRPATRRPIEGRRTLPALALLASTAVALLLVAGCSSDGSDGDDATSTTATTPASTTTTAPTSSSTSGATGDTVVVQVFFLDEDAFNIGRPPYVQPVERTVDATEPAQGALDELFAGPTADERAAGLRLVASGATGVSSVRIEDGTAHVQLAGGCSSGGSTFTVADQIAATLRQFVTVDSVKVYDPSGATERPEEPGDSIPTCLEP
ncbi:MAG: GerMN domain-containing protein [Acidimicrobiales bacterium]